MKLLKQTRKKLIQNLHRGLYELVKRNVFICSSDTQLKYYIFNKLIHDIDDFDLSLFISKSKYKKYRCPDGLNFLFCAEIQGQLNRNKLYYLDLLRSLETNIGGPYAATPEEKLSKLDFNLLICNILDKYRVYPIGSINFISNWLNSVKTYSKDYDIQFLMASFIGNRLRFSASTNLSKLIQQGLSDDPHNKFLLLGLQSLNYSNSRLYSKYLSKLVNHKDIELCKNIDFDRLLDLTLDVRFISNFLYLSNESKSKNVITNYCSKYNCASLNLPSRASLYLLPEIFIESFPITVFNNINEDLLKGLQELNIKGLEVFTHLDNYFDDSSKENLYTITVMFRSFVYDYLSLSEKYLDKKSQRSFKLFLYKCISNLNSEYLIINKSPITLKDITNALIHKGQIITISIRFLTYFIFSTNFDVTTPIFRCLNILVAQKQLLDDLCDYFEDLKSGNLNVCHCILKNKGFTEDQTKSDSFYQDNISLEAYKILRIFDSNFVRNLKILDDIFGFKLTYLHNERLRNLAKIENLNQDRLDYLKLHKFAFATTAKNPYDKHNVR